MDADELVDQVNGENDSSISSMDVSEDEGQNNDANTKKRKREEEAVEDDEEPERILYVAELG